MTLTLKTETRDGKRRAGALRRAGKLPAVLYGRKQKAVSVAVSAPEFLKVWKQAGETGVVTLQTSEGELDALIHALDRDPLTEAVRHADFYVFEKGQKLKVKVPIAFIGVSPAVKDLGGVLVKVLRELEIEAEPRNLPHQIEVDVSLLAAFGNVITAKEIKLPPGVSLVALPDDVVASVYEPKEEVVEEAVAPPDLSQIEVQKKGKEAKEGETAEGTPATAPKEGAAPQKEAKKEAKKENK